MKTVFDILIAVLAVFGGYSALKLLSEKIFIPQRFAPIAAIRLDGSEDDDTAHGGRALLNKVTLGAVGSNLLADTLDLQ